MRIAIAGKNAIATEFLEFAATRLPTKSLLAIPNRDDSGRTSWQPSLRRAARSLGVEVGSLEEAETRADVFVSCEFDRIIRPSLFRTPLLFNIHFSLLPKYRGVATSIWPLLNDDSMSGVTLHWVDAGIDTGPVIAQRSYAITGQYTARHLYLANVEAGIALLTEHFDQLLSGSAPRLPQPATGASYFGRHHVDWGAAHRTDFTHTAWQASLHIRAYSFFEYQLPHVAGRPVHGVEILSRASGSKAGTILETDEEHAIIATADFDVLVSFDQRMRFLDAVGRHDDRTVRTISQNPNFRGPRGWSPLHVAAYNGWIAQVEALLSRGDTDVDFSNHRGTTPLMYARSCADRRAAAAITRLLLEAGADVERMDEDGRSAIDYAREDGQDDFLTWVRRT